MIAVRSSGRASLVVLLVGSTLAGDAVAQAPATQTITIRGHAQSLRLYGTRGQTPVIVSSGDGGWIHLGPHVAEVLAARGFFVVGFDVKAYLESFTSGKVTLRPEDEPGDYKVLADFAARGATQKPILIGVSEGAGLSVLAATDPQTKPSIAGVLGVGPSRPQRAGLAVEGLLDLPDARRPERADVQRGRDCRSREPDARSPRSIQPRTSSCPLAEVQQDARRRQRAEEAVDREGLRPPVQRQPRGVRSAASRGDRLDQQNAAR